MRCDFDLRKNLLRGARNLVKCNAHPHLMFDSFDRARPTLPRGEPWFIGAGSAAGIRPRPKISRSSAQSKALATLLLSTFVSTTPGPHCQSCLGRLFQKPCVRFVGLRSTQGGQRYEMQSLSHGPATGSPRATNKSAPRPPGWCCPTALRADETTMAARNRGGEQSTAPSRA